MLRLFILLLLCCFLDSVTAQKVRPVWKNEIGFDLRSSLLQGEGIEMIIKHRLDTVGAVRTAKTLRFLGGFFKEVIPVYSFYRVGDTVVTRTSDHSVKRNYFLFMGLEFQKMKKRWRFYTGPEFGYHHSIYKADYLLEKKVQGSSVVLSSDVSNGEVTTRSPRVGGFAGLQYFFARRWSIGLEVSLNFGIEFTHSKTFQGGVVEGENNSIVLDLNNQLFRLFYLSCHFGKTDKRKDATQ